MNSIYEVRILIVDDNKDLLRLLCEQLSGAGYRHIQTAANCAAAKKLFAAEIPELMILDINLPDGDGFSLFRALHAKADVPALFLSARDADADRLFGLGLGADDYLTKPSDAGTTSSCSAYPAENLSRRTRPHKVKRFETCRSKRGSERCSCHTFKRRYDSSDSYRTGTASQTGG